MKKIFVLFSCLFSIILLTGCGMDNTPTKRVEGFLDSYRKEDSNVIDQLKEMVDADSLMNDSQKEEYTSIIKNQYKNMTYEIKDEEINGNDATVTAEVEVYDYYKVNKDSEEYYNNNQNEFEENSSVAEDIKDAADKVKEKAEDVAEDVKDAVTSKKESNFVDYRLGKLKETKDRVKYTIDFSLTKVDSKLVLNDIDEVTRQKLHGLYEH